MLKKVLLVTVALLMMLNLAQPLQAQIIPNADFYNGLCWTWEIIGPQDPVYNCLSYAIGVTNTWTWPWSGSLPTSSQVDSYMLSKGYFLTGNVKAIISYGLSSSSIGHFSKIATPSTCTAKCGAYHLLKHYSWDPYKDRLIYNGSNIAFGAMRKVYYNPDPLNASIVGPSSAPSNVIYNWTAYGSGGVPPYSYQWYYSFSSPSSTTNALGSTRTVSASLKKGRNLYLKVIVTDSRNNTATAYKTVINDPNGGDPDPRMNSNHSILKNRIEALRFDLLSADKRSSNPYDYINNDCFRAIVAMGPEALETIRRELIVSEKNGLVQYILAIAAEKIAATDLKKQKLVWEHAQDWAIKWDMFLAELPERVDAIVNSSEKASVKRSQLESLGYAALPLLEDRVKEGNVELKAAFENLKCRYLSSATDSNRREAVKSVTEVSEIFRTMINKRR